MSATGEATVTGADLHGAIRYRAGMGEKVYAVVDAARDKELVQAARDQGEETVRWLFADNAAAHLANVAPYLIQVPYQSAYPYRGCEYLDLWGDKLGSSAGVLLMTEAPPGVVWSHLRKLFKVTDEDDRRFYFRFYDPRVLRAYLPTCTLAEAKEFLGPIRRILVEAEAPGRMISCDVRRGELKIDELPIGKAAAPRPASGPGR